MYRLTRLLAFCSAAPNGFKEFTSPPPPAKLGSTSKLAEGNREREREGGKVFQSIVKFIFANKRLFSHWRFIQYG